MIEKKKLLVWSGGMDSTAVLLNCCNSNISIDTLYINQSNVDEGKRQQEKKSREVILKAIRETWKLEWEINDYEVCIGAISGMGVGLSQPALWMFASAIFFNIHKYESIVFGYVRGDDFWHRKHEFLNAFNYTFMLYSGRNVIPHVEFPLEWDTKEEIVSNVYVNNSVTREVFGKIWTCEEPEEGKECGKCKPCLSIKPARELFAQTIEDRIQDQTKEGQQPTTEVRGLPGD